MVVFADLLLAPLKLRMPPVEEDETPMLLVVVVMLLLPRLWVLEPKLPELLKL